MGIFSTGNFPSFSEGLSLRGVRPAGSGIKSSNFPSFSEGLSLRERIGFWSVAPRPYFPSFSEGLSLRDGVSRRPDPRRGFPFLFGGTFIEGYILPICAFPEWGFPFLFGGTFIEGRNRQGQPPPHNLISLPFRRDFH